MSAIKKRIIKPICSLWWTISEIIIFVETLLWKISIFFTWNLTNSSAPKLSLDKIVLIVSSPSFTVEPSWSTSFPLSSTKSRT